MSLKGKMHLFPDVVLIPECLKLKALKKASLLDLPILGVLGRVVASTTVVEIFESESARYVSVISSFVTFYFFSLSSDVKDVGV